MKQIVKEFKEFIMRGNVIDLAVGVIIGGAFQAIVNSLVNDIINPLLSIFLKDIDFSSLTLNILNAKIAYGSLINAIITFLINGIVIFFIIKAINTAASLKKAPEAVEEAPVTKVCPYCFSEIHIDATRCPHCTSQLEK